MVVTLDDVIGILKADAAVPFFQPIVELRTGELTGFEVLARYLDPKSGPVLPQNFIALAEQNGLIAMLSGQIFRKAFAAGALLRDPLTLSINVSPIQMQFKRLPDEIREAAEANGFPMNRVKVEITETALLDDLVRPVKIAKTLKKMGCRLSLDDFGTGASSLRHLQALPFDELKVDRSFVVSMTKKRESRKIVAAVVGLGQSLGLSTVAEGIETEEQAAMMLRLGCKAGQGWHYGRPVSAEHLPEIIMANPRPISEQQMLFNKGISSLEALPTQRLAQLQAIYDGAPVGLCFLDKELRYVSLNERMSKINGCSVHAHLGRTVSEVLPGAFATLEPYLLRALKGEAIGGVKITRPPVRPGTRSRSILASYQPAWDESDEVIGVSVAVADLTEYLREEVEEKHRARDVFDPRRNDAPNRVAWMMDRNGKSLQADSPWPSATPAKRKGTGNIPWLKALHPDDLAIATQVVSDALVSGDPIDMQYRAKEGDVWKRKRAQGSARFGPDGEITRWHGDTKDIDEHQGN